MAAAETTINLRVAELHRQLDVPIDQGMPESAGLSPEAFQALVGPLLGSESGDKRVSGAWVSTAAPRLGWCWLGMACAAPRVGGSA